MPVPIPGPKVGYDSQKVKFFMIFGRPKTGIFQRFRGVPAKLIINNVPKGSYVEAPYERPHCAPALRSVS